MQKRRNSTANALELHLSCTNPSIWGAFYEFKVWLVFYFVTAALYAALLYTKSSSIGLCYSWTHNSDVTWVSWCLIFRLTTKETSKLPITGLLLGIPSVTSDQIKRLVQERCNSIAYVLELCLSCTNLSKCHINAFSVEIPFCPIIPTLNPEIAAFWAAPYPSINHNWPL